MNSLLRIGFFGLLALLALSSALAQDSDWPRTVTIDGGTVTIYEPQVDELRDDFIRFRAALAWRGQPGDEPVFGAGWFESDAQVDRLSGTIHPLDLRVTQTRFPVEADVQTALSRAMAEPSFASNFTFSLDEIEASIKTTEAETLAAAQLNTAPPIIHYRDRPALLVSIDGEPILREIENSTYRAVINTPYPLITDGRYYYLNAAKDVWYRGISATGPFRFTGSVPSGVASLVTPEDEAVAAKDPANDEKVTASNAPEIIVSTEPAELLVTDGPAAFVPLVEDLLVLNNSDDDVFLHLAEQAYYIVLAGRWYRAKSLAGPWAYRDSDELPDAFSLIPQDSDQADSRVYVAGTEEAEEAVLDAQVPQTAAVERGEADVEVEYDGEPVFAPVDGTDMTYATNTGSTVLLANGLYYMVEDGVWYVSTSYNGPWQVAVARPDQVRVILPSSPVYNVKYVYVYDVTPEVVYVGYTPGYLGSYVYRNTVFYGSGWYYQPWVSARWYYPYHRTWGFHVNYDPWYGWNFGLSWAWGPFSLSFWPGGHWHHHHHWYHGHYSYWGPHGYRPRHHHYRPHQRPPGHHRPPGRGGGHRPQPYERHPNLYADARQRARIVDTYDKPPREFNSRRGKDEFVSRAYVKNGLGHNGQAIAKKTSYASTKPLTKGELSKKARSSRMGVVSKAEPSAVSKRKVHPGRMAVPKGQLSRNELAVKAKSSEQRFKTGQKTVTASKGTRARERTIRTPIAKLDRNDLSRYESVGGTAKTKLTSRSNSRSKPTVSKPSAPSRTGNVAKIPAAKTYTKQPQTTVRRSRSKTVGSYTQPNRAPVVKLTNPRRSPAYTASGARAVIPKVSRASPPKAQMSAGYKAPAKSVSTPKQKFSAPEKRSYKAPSHSKQARRSK